MTDTNTKVREHYSATGLTNWIKSALATLAPESQMLNWLRVVLGDCSVLKRSHRNPRSPIY